MSEYETEEDAPFTFADYVFICILVVAFFLIASVVLKYV